MDRTDRAAHIAALIADAPRLTQQQVSKLSVLIGPVDLTEVE
ncbi:MAG TPA: hypothetical protein VME67_03675 [Mycobacterium sp.]|nr:hypothetical protein [Mycobacterium sp.]HTX94002.1 hypothetical protein [Mycobacterium sp.]